jgi:hypothetical protein
LSFAACARPFQVEIMSTSPLWIACIACAPDVHQMLMCGLI